MNKEEDSIVKTTIELKNSLLQTVKSLLDADDDTKCSTQKEYFRLAVKEKVEREINGEITDTRKEVKQKNTSSDGNKSEFKGRFYEEQN